MTADNHFYLTTTTPYANGKPHIGHTLEFIQADVICRYRRMIGQEVYFNTGTDEHGLKMFEGAEKEGMTPKEYVDKYSQTFKDFCEKFHISYDRFIRTTDPDHYETAKKFWEDSLAAGDIYKKQYEGMYCVGCEEFKTEKDLLDGLCPDHGKAPITHSEENYFFKFSKYQDQLLELYAKNKEFVKPESKLTEMVKFASRGLEDFSISRRKENLPWGVPVPGDEDQVMYVWFDALVNYVTTIGYLDDPDKFKKWWPALQICGPDNNRFQSAMWQAMLMSVGVEPSKQILIHGMILAEDGTKMSKTKGNVVSPIDLIEKYGVEATRYYMIAGIPTFSDSPFSYEQLESKYRADLQNNFGNLLNRIITLINKKDVEVDSSLITKEFEKQVDTFKEKYDDFMFKFEMFDAMNEVTDLGELGNGYITKEEPWAKDKTKEEISIVLNNLVYLVETMMYCYTPVIPKSVERGMEALEKLENIILFESFED